MTGKHFQINLLALGLVVFAAIIHYLLPNHELFSNIAFFIAVLLHSSIVWGPKRTAIYVIAAMIIGYFAEFIGINTGLVFGVYHYNASKDPAMLYGVPLFIPMMYSYLIYTGHFVLLAISKRLLQKSNLIILAVLTGFMLTLKDLGTDPLHSTIAQVWIWNNGGAYFGVPIHNFIGWFGVFLVMTLVTVPLAWHRGGYSTQVILEKQTFYVPLLLFSVIILFGITSAFQVPGADQALGQVSAFVTIFTLVPYLILAWINKAK